MESGDYLLVLAKLVIGMAGLLRSLHNECFIPIGEAVEEKEVDDDKLDRILAEFEMKTKGDNRL